MSPHRQTLPAPESWLDIARSRIFWRILLGFMLVAATLSLGLVETLREFGGLQRDFDDLIKHDFALVDDSERLEFLVALLQSRRRYYVLSGDEPTRERYVGARREIDETMARLQRETMANRNEAEAYTRLAPLLRETVRLSDVELNERATIAAGSSALDDMVARFSSGPLVDTTQRVNTLLQEMHDDARRDAESRQRAVSVAARRARSLVQRTLVVALLVAMLYGTYMARDIGRALRGLQGSLDRLGFGPVPEAVPERPDEIGDVARSFDRMAQRLSGTEAALRAKVDEQEALLRELREANAAIAQAMRVKSDFLATMSHELRTPLNAVIGLSAMLIDSPHETLSNRARTALATMRDSGTHLLAVLNDLLDMAKLDAGRMRFSREPVELAALVRGCVATVIPLVGERPVELGVRIPAGIPAVRADAQRTRQVLLNLLSNAVKFTSKGEVMVEVTARSRDVEVAVRDTGIGIAAEQIGLLFEEFRQLDTGDARAHGGTGLGLSLSRRMARAMGGDITVASVAGEGSTFTLRLPRVDAEGATEDAARVDRPAGDA